MTYKAQVFYGYGGCYAEWYRDDDNNSGYGDNARIARRYGSRQECEAVAGSATPPAGIVWIPINGWSPDMSPGSAAWCESYGE
jgi:hypothetical protein